MQFLDFEILGPRNQAVEAQGTGGGRFLKEPGSILPRTTPPIAWEKVRTPLGKPNLGKRITNAGRATSGRAARTYPQEGNKILSRIDNRLPI